MKYILLLALLATPAAAAPATQPSALIDTLLRQLAADDWKVRQQAQERLVDLGEPAVEALKRLAAETRDEEARTRAEAALRQIAERDRSGPTLITLQLNDVPLQVAVEEIARQAKVEIGGWPSFIWKQAPAKISLDVTRKPFWLVMRDLNEKTGLAPERMGAARNQISLVQKSEGWSKRPHSLHGPFMVVANGANRNHSIDYAVPENVSKSFTIQLQAFVDPKVKVMQGSSLLRIDEATDDRGNSLVIPNSRTVQSMSAPGFNAGWIWDLHASLQYPANVGTHITLLRATARFLVQGKADVWEIPDITKANHVERVMPMGRYVVQGVRKSGERNYELQIGIEHPPDVVAHGHPLTDFATLQRCIRLLDADGNAYDPAGGGGGGGAGRLQYTLNFYAPANDPNRRVGEPAKLVWEIPIDVKEVDVPVVLRDLKIP